jgi:CRISPR/Cas system-associated endonuclease Cas1
MSKDIARAYQEFLKMEKKRNSKMQDRKAVASTGLLAPRAPRRDMQAEGNTQADTFDTIYNIVAEIRKYGGKKDETNA